MRDRGHRDPFGEEKYPATGPRGSQIAINALVSSTQMRPDTDEAG